MGCTRSTHSGGREVVRFPFVPGDRWRYPADRLSYELYSVLDRLFDSVCIGLR